MLKGPYLRVLTPLTENGINPVMTPEGKIKFRESHLHISAKKRMEGKNAKLPQHLKHVIEVVSDDQQPPAVPIQRPSPAPQDHKQPARTVAPPPFHTQEGDATNGQESHEETEAPRQEPKKVAKRRRRPAAAKK